MIKGGNTIEIVIHRQEGCITWIGCSKSTPKINISVWDMQETKENEHITDEELEDLDKSMFELAPYELGFSEIGRDYESNYNEK
jgi:hypothetical protein